MWAAEPARATSRPSAAELVALFLLHEEPHRVDRASVERVLPPRALGLPDALLRELAALEVVSLRWPKDAVERLAARRSLPRGLARSLIEQLGSSEADAAAAALNRPGPVTLRANLLAPSRDRGALLAALRREGVRCRAGTLSPWSVFVDAAEGRQTFGGSVWSLRAWKEGLCEVQDEGSQCIALACEAAAGERVLDVCAGNGGKTLALAAQVGPSGEVVASDVVDRRLAALRASAARAHCAAWVETRLVCDAAARADGEGAMSESAMSERAMSEGAGSCEDRGEGEAIATLRQPSRRSGATSFDLALVDAPCSSSGTLRRHPGLRWSGQWSETAQGAVVDEQGQGRGAMLPLASFDEPSPAAAREHQAVLGRRRLPALQRRLVARAVALVRPGGRLVYATCALDPDENDAVADAIEADSSLGALLQPWPFDEGTAGRHERTGHEHRRTLWPHRHGTDGFFIARWRRL